MKYSYYHKKSKSFDTKFFIDPVAAIFYFKKAGILKFITKFTIRIKSLFLNRI